MNWEKRIGDSVRAIEKLVLEKFRTEPFQNLRMIWGSRFDSALPGGTCTEKTLSFLDKARESGFDVKLHTGFIHGQEIHRLARVHVDGRLYFADVGNGWPALRLFPADAEISFRCFGMRFRTEIADGRVRVYLAKWGKETLQVEIDIQGKPEAAILSDIKNRFGPGKTYPFSDSLRFSLVVGDKFLFLRGESLEIHTDGGSEIREGIRDDCVADVLQEHFGFDLRSYIR